MATSAPDGFEALLGDDRHRVVERRAFGDDAMTVYALHGHPGHFRSVVYEKTGHEYLPEMKAEMLAWFEEHLPVGR